MLHAAALFFVTLLAAPPLAVPDANWDPDVRLTNNTWSDNSYWTSQRRVAVGPDGRIHVVWYVQNSGLGAYPFQVYAKRYNPGVGWSNDTMISADLYTANTNNKYPSIAVDSSGRVWVAWSSGTTTDATQQIYVKSCLPVGNGNDGWDVASQLLSVNPSNYTKECPTLAATPDGHVHAAWLEYTANRYIAYRERIDTIWQSQVNLEMNASRKFYPSLAGDRNNNLHLTWYGDMPPATSGYYEVIYKGRVGTTWGAVENVSASPNHSMYQTVCINPVTNRPHVVWQDYVASGAPYRLVHAERTGTSTWVKDTVSDITSTVSQQPGQIIFTADGRGHATWRGRNGTMTRDEIMYNERSVLGVWGTPVPITDTTGTKDRPSIANGGSYSLTDLHVVWSDYRDGNSEMYYKHGTLLPPSPPTLTLTSPNGGEVFFVNTTAAVRSTHGGGPAITDSVWLSTDGGASWNFQFARAAADSHPWTVPALPTVAGRIRIVTRNPGGAAADSSDADFTIADPNATVEAIIAPTGSYDTGTVITPRARISYTGNISSVVHAWLRIRTPAGGQSYWQQVDFTAAPPALDTIISFPQFTAGPDTGLWAVRCSIYVAGDRFPAGDRLDSEFRVNAPQTPPPPPAGWTEIAQVPLSPSGKAVKDGGAIAYDAGSARLYVLKGNKTGDFYSFDGTTWTTLTAIPVGTEAKPPAKGAGICTDGNGVVYAVKGNNTQGFWQYSGGTWTQLLDIPLGVSNKKVKGGTDLVYVDAGDSQYVYLLKGYKTEFYRYNITSGVWQPLADAPAGQKPKWDKGSWLAFDPAGNRIFAHKAKYHELYAYDLATGNWGEQLAGMPLLNSQTGKSKKSKDGGSAAFLADGMLYALKGGNTCDFYAYEPGSNQWAEKETMPQVGSSQKKKRVKGGGDITSDGSCLYALKGNKTQELWRYVPAAGQPAFVRLVPERGGVQSGAAGLSGRLVSGLVRSSGSLQLGGLPAGRLTLELYDAAGRLVLLRPVSGGTAVLPALAPGVYLLRVDRSTGKLVVE